MTQMRPIAVLALLPALLLVAGCQAPVQRRAPGPIAGTQGAAAEAVFASPEVVAAGEPDWVVGRRDLVFAQGPATSFDVEAWPGPDRPTLDDARRIYFDSNSTTSDRFTYLRSSLRGWFIYGGHLHPHR